MPFDYDVIVIGSGFGGSVAAMRATEKGYRVGVMEAGRRFLDPDIPTTSWDVRKFVWQPELEMFGMQRIEYLEDVLVLSGAGVGGGSNTYANTLYVPPTVVWDNPLVSDLADWSSEMSPHYAQAQRMLGVVRAPYMDSDPDRVMREVAADMGRPEAFSRPPMGIYFGTPGVEAEDPFFGGVGPPRLMRESSSGGDVCLHRRFGDGGLVASVLSRCRTLGVGHLPGPPDRREY